jgi:hypothetical protein
VNGDGNLYVYPLEPQPGGGGGGRGGGAVVAGRPGSSRHRRAPSESAVHADSREVFYLEGGRINVANVDRVSRARST